MVRFDLVDVDRWDVELGKSVKVPVLHVFEKTDSFNEVARVATEEDKLKHPALYEQFEKAGHLPAELRGVFIAGIKSNSKVAEKEEDLPFEVVEAKVSEEGPADSSNVNPELGS